MNDRLGDLGWDDADDEAFENEPEKKADVEAAHEPRQPRHMEHFFREVEGIKDDIEAVKAATRVIGEINDEAIRATTSEEETELSNRLRPLIDGTNKRAKRTKTMLSLLKEETKKLTDEEKIKQSDLR
jgi:hypothetical protein